MGIRLLLAALVVLTLPDGASAGYPVQPSDGKVITTLSPTFLVYYDADELSARVDVSSSPQTSSSGSLLLLQGYLGSCYPTTPFNEPGKFTCSLSFSSEGTYYWQFVYDKYGCKDFGYGYRYCSYRPQYGPVWAFTIQLPAKPVEAALPAVSRATGSSHVAPKYGEIASKIAKKAVTVNCWSRSDWNALHASWSAYEGARGGSTSGLSNTLGYVRPDRSDVINLAPDVCARLDLLFYLKKRPRAPGAMFDVARAVVTLAHEAIHAVGVVDEADTECYALQDVQFAAGALGTTWSYGRTLANLLWTKDWPRWEGTEYWTGDCYDGGPLDLRPGSSVWP